MRSTYWCVQLGIYIVATLKYYKGIFVCKMTSNMYDFIFPQRVAPKNVKNAGYWKLAYGDGGS